MKIIVENDSTFLCNEKYKLKAIKDKSKNFNYIEIKRNEEDNDERIKELNPDDPENDDYSKKRNSEKRESKDKSNNEKDKDSKNDNDSTKKKENSSNNSPNDSSDVIKDNQNEKDSVAQVQNDLINDQSNDSSDILKDNQSEIEIIFQDKVVEINKQHNDTSSSNILHDDSNNNLSKSQDRNENQDEENNIDDKLKEVIKKLNRKDFNYLKDNKIETKDLGLKLHQILGHLSKSQITSKFNIQMPEFKCDSCSSTKFKQKNYKVNNENYNVGEMIAFDIMGPLNVKSYDGKRFILVIVDYGSNYIHVKPLEFKSEVSFYLIEFLNLIKQRFKLNILLSDNAKENLTDDIKRYIFINGIINQETPSYSPTANPRVERNNQTIFRLILANLKDINMKTVYWTLTIDHIMISLNSRIYKDNKSSYQIIFNRKPYLKNLMPFGTPLYTENNNNTPGKFKEKSKVSIFLSVNPVSNNIRVFNIDGIQYSRSYRYRYTLEEFDNELKDIIFTNLDIVNNNYILNDNDTDRDNNNNKQIPEEITDCIGTDKIFNFYFQDREIELKEQIYDDDNQLKLNLENYENENVKNYKELQDILLNKNITNNTNTENNNTDNTGNSSSLIQEEEERSNKRNRINYSLLNKGINYEELYIDANNKVKENLKNLKILKKSEDNIDTRKLKQEALIKNIINLLNMKFLI